MKLLTNYIYNILLFFFLPYLGLGQTTISGVVTENNETPILGANVYLEGTYDGASTDIDGSFSFKTSETGEQTLIISFVSFESFKMSADVTQLKNLIIKLREDVNSLETVVISAGTFEASDNSKISVLKPLDVVINPVGEALAGGPSGFDHPQHVLDGGVVLRRLRAAAAKMPLNQGRQVDGQELPRERHVCVNDRGPLCKFEPFDEPCPEQVVDGPRDRALVHF